MFENDFMAFRLLDEFRTFASEVNYKRNYHNNILGLGLSFFLWTGTTKGLGFLHKNEQYNLTTQYGGKYANGVFALKIYYNNFDFGIGYDSEKIRTVIQNNFHKIIDDGMLPAINKKNRIYLQLNLYDFGSLY